MAFSTEAAVAIIENEGEVLSGFTPLAVDVIRPLLAAAGRAVERVIDLGCGPGVATCVLAELFDPAVVVAADSSAPMLARVSARAARLGRSTQVEQRQLDLDGDLSVLGHCDLVHASMALHHVRDEVSTLRQVRDLVEPDGLLCLLERAAPLRVQLAEELARPGLWDRIDDAWRRWFEDARGELPGATGADRYPVVLTSAGFDVLVDESVELRVDLADNPTAVRFAARQLERAAIALARHADPADLRPLPDLARSIADFPAAWSGALHATRRLLVAVPG